MYDHKIIVISDVQN